MVLIGGEMLDKPDLGAWYAVYNYQVFF